MFEVWTTSPIDDEWEGRDAEIAVAAGTRPKRSYTEGSNVRGHGWLVKSFKKALKMKKALEAVPMVNVTIREYTSHSVWV